MITLRQPRSGLLLLAASALVPAMLAVAALPAPPPANGFAELAAGRVGEAAAIAQQQLAKDPHNGTAHVLLCRVDYAQNLIDPAVSECQAAAAAFPNSSDAQMWLGRALGAKASHVGGLTAFSTARKVRDAFERAVQLGPANADAASDLAEFYVGAPGIVGGGRDKASRLASTEASRYPALSHRILALIAEKNDDLGAAESEYKSAIAVAGTPETYIDLANFYQTYHRPGEAAGAAKRAIAADPEHGPPLVDAASILTDAGEEPALAEQCLRDYIRSTHQSDAAPVFKAELALGHLLAKQGDQAGARAHYQAAAALAPQFAPARKAAGLQ